MWYLWQRLRLIGVTIVLASAFVLSNNRRPGPLAAGSGGLGQGGTVLASQSGIFSGRKTQRYAWWGLGIGTSIMIGAFALRKYTEREEKRLIALQSMKSNNDAKSAKSRT